MNHFLDAFPRLKQLLELFARIEDPNNVHAGYIKLACFVPGDPEWHEANLERLDARAWEAFVNKIRRQLCTQRENHQRRQFWQLLNESRGYVWLADHGYSAIEFIPEEGTEKRAELIAESPTRAILEVKTINRSDDDREREKKRNDPAYLADYIINLSAFVQKLIQKADPLSSFIWEHLPEPVQELLARFVPETCDAMQVESRLTEGLKRVIEGPCIYEPMRFSGIRPENFQDPTRYLLEEYRRGGPMGSANVACLNRCLLDDAYPEELCQWSKYLSVEVYRPNMPVPDKLLEKLEGTIGTARRQIEETLKHTGPVDKRIVLLIINRDFGCSNVTMKQLEAKLQKPDLEIVCEIGDF
jgi:hypothetical protein